MEFCRYCARVTPDLVFVDCGHVFCKSCASKAPECPFCCEARTIVADIHLPPFPRKAV